MIEGTKVSDFVKNNKIDINKLTLYDYLSKERLDEDVDTYKDWVIVEYVSNDLGVYGVYIELYIKELSEIEVQNSKSVLKSALNTTCVEPIESNESLKQEMTNEEAINLLANATYSNEWQGNEDLTKAHYMAIKELWQKQKKGRWIEVIDEIDNFGSKTRHHECSICGNEDSGWGTYKYCPNCGAEMERSNEK